MPHGIANEQSELEFMSDCNHHICMPLLSNSHESNDIQSTYIGPDSLQVILLTYLERLSIAISENIVYSPIGIRSEATGARILIYKSHIQQKIQVHQIKYYMIKFNFAKYLDKLYEDASPPRYSEATVPSQHCH